MIRERVGAQSAVVQSGVCVREDSGLGEREQAGDLRPSTDTVAELYIRFFQSELYIRFFQKKIPGEFGESFCGAQRRASIWAGTIVMSR